MAEDHGAFKTNPRDLPPILASCGVLSTPLHGSLSDQERSARVRFGIRGRRFYRTRQDGLRYSQLGPIRAAERPAKRCERGRFVVTAFPNGSKPGSICPGGIFPFHASRLPFSVCRRPGVRVDPCLWTGGSGAAAGCASGIRQRRILGIGARNAGRPAERDRPARAGPVSGPDARSETAAGRAKGQGRQGDPRAGSRLSPGIG